MRKSLIYAFTAAAMTAAGAAAPMTAQAAVNTYTLPGGNGQAIVISGNLNSFNCENGFPGIQLPDNMFPGSQIPGSMLPDNLFPIPDFGGQGGTDGGIIDGGIMQGWMNSSGHRANILNDNFTKIGVGHYKSASGVDYWTQLFTN